MMLTNRVAVEDRFSLGKVVEWLGSLPLLALALVVAAITLVDRLQLFGWRVYPTLPVTASEGEVATYSLMKLLVLFVSLLAASVAADRMLHFTRLEKHYGAISQSYTELAQAQNSSVRVLVTRAEWYRAFLEVVTSASYGSQIIVTAYEKLKMSYDSGEEAVEQTLMALYEKRLSSGELSVEQLVHVATRQDLEEAWKRVQRHANLPNFTLTCLVGVAPEPLFEFATVGSEIVLTGFSTKSGSPYAVESGHEIHSAEIVELYRSHARLWSSAFGVPLKTRDAVQESAYQRLKSQLPEGHALDLPSDLRLNALRAYRDKLAYADILSLISSQEMLDAETSELQQARMRVVRQRAVADARDIADGRIRFVGDGFREVHALISRASVEIFAICPASSIEFWRKAAGQRLEKAFATAIQRDVAVTRIFGLHENWEADPSVVDILRRQSLLGVKVLIAPSGSSGNDASRDFMIVDGATVFEDRVGGREGHSLVLVSEAMVREYRESWEFLIQIAEPWTDV